MVYIAEKQLATTPSITHSTPKKSLETSYQAALEHARRLTQMYGIGATQVAVAWDAVEELIIAKCRQQENHCSGFDRYCALNPDAPECRIYES